MLTSFLPIALGLLLMAYFSISILQFDLQQNHICRTQSLKTQNEVGKLLQELLAQNPKAARLRQDEWRLRAEILAAPNPIAKARALAQLQKVLFERQVLGQKQKQFIRTSDLLLHQGHLKAQRQMRQNQQAHWGSLRTWVSGRYREMPTTAPRLAVRPDFPDMAPVYLPQEGFADKQTLAHRWQYDFQPRPPFSAFLKGSFSWSKDCAVTLESKGKIWSAKIHKGKSLSKSLW